MFYLFNYHANDDEILSEVFYFMNFYMMKDSDRIARIEKVLSTQIGQYSIHYFLETGKYNKVITRILLTLSNLSGSMLDFMNTVEMKVFIIRTFKMKLKGLTVNCLWLIINLVRSSKKHFELMFNSEILRSVFSCSQDGSDKIREAAAECIYAFVSECNNNNIAQMISNFDLLQFLYSSLKDKNETIQLFYLESLEIIIGISQILEINNNRNLLITELKAIDNFSTFEKLSCSKNQKITEKVKYFLNNLIE